MIDVVKYILIITYNKSVLSCEYEGNNKSTNESVSSCESEVNNDNLKNLDRRRKATSLLMKVYPFVNLKLTVMCLHLQVYTIEMILKKWFNFR